MKVDILAIGVHPDDVELSIGGTIIKHVAAGKKVAILDLTQEDDKHSSDSYEIFYKITDIVLIICAVVFIISAIASITLWISGIILIDFVKDVLSGTRKNLTNSQHWS